MSDAPAFDLGHGLTAASAPTLPESARYCRYLADEIRHRHDRRVEVYGHAPNASDLYDAAVLDLATKILRLVEEHEGPVKAAIQAEKKRLADADRAEAEKAARVQAAIARRRREEREERAVEAVAAPEPEVAHG